MRQVECMMRDGEGMGESWRRESRTAKGQHQAAPAAEKLTVERSRLLLISPILMVLAVVGLRAPHHEQSAERKETGGASLLSRRSSIARHLGQEGSVGITPGGAEPQ